MTEPALLLLDFVNTRDFQPDTDELETPGKLTAWLAEHHLVPADTGPGEPGELALAVTLREGLRAALLTHHGPDQQALPAGLDHVLSELPVRVSLTADGPALRPVGDGIIGGLSGLTAAIMETVADGTWPRLKVCLEDTCRWAFLDTSKNRSRSWCSMRTCGNRTKTRTDRARRRAGEGAQ
jgi:predicted RNA-binding Zn ribbon-like protein